MRASPNSSFSLSDRFPRRRPAASGPSAVASAVRSALIRGPPLKGRASPSDGADCSGGAQTGRAYPKPGSQHGSTRLLYAVASGVYEPLRTSDEELSTRNEYFGLRTTC